MRQRQRFNRCAYPMISVDTKKKELVGQFKNHGRVWSRQAIPVQDHDFRSQAKGLAIPYGIYDLQANRGWVVVGTSHDTPMFAVESICQWWRGRGRQDYGDAPTQSARTHGSPRVELYSPAQEQSELVFARLLSHGSSPYCRRFFVNLRVAHRHEIQHGWGGFRFALISRSHHES